MPVLVMYPGAFDGRHVKLFARLSATPGRRAFKHVYCFLEDFIAQHRIYMRIIMRFLFASRQKFALTGVLREIIIKIIKASYKVVRFGRWPYSTETCRNAERQVSSFISDSSKYRSDLYLLRPAQSIEFMPARYGMCKGKAFPDF